MIGMMAGWSLTIAVFLLLGVILKERVWYYPPMLIFGVLASTAFTLIVVPVAYYALEKRKETV